MSGRGGTAGMDRSRTEYSARNMTVAMAGRVAAILAGFYARIVFTHTLSQDYVGVNGLFADILNILNLSELGAGVAITYALYRPIAEEDVEKQKSLMRLSRRFYHMVAAIVLAGGLLIIPFMDRLIKNQPQVDHLILIYLLYLTNSVLSYFMIYKRTLIEAHQLSCVTVLYQTGANILQSALQIVVLRLTGNFILFVSMMIVCTLLNNAAVSAKADRLYPYLKDRDVEELPAQERREIFRNTRAMLMHKIGTVAVSNTDNLLLSALVGIVSNGLYSNYYLIIGSIRQVLNQIFQGITASVGNLGVERDRARIQRIFEASFFMGQWIFGLAAICLYELIDPFVGLCFGESYVFSRDITLVLCLNFYLAGMRQAALIFRDSLGVFWYDRYKALVEAAVNLIASILLGRSLGALGIFLGTLVSTVSVSLWVEPLMLYRHCLKTSARPFFLRYGLYVSATILIWLGEDALCRRIGGGPVAAGAKRLMVCLVVTNLAYLLIYHRTKEFRLLADKGRALIARYAPRPAGRSAPPQPPVRTREETALLSLLRAELTGGAEPPPEGTDWTALENLAERHQTLSLLYTPLTEYAPDPVRTRAAGEARRIVLQNYRLLFLSRYLTRRLAEEGISTALLKGVSAAVCYPTPELRKSGDVDLLLLEPAKLEAACRVLEKAGCVRLEKQEALHHISFHQDGVGVELHTMLAEPFDDRGINAYLRSLLDDCRDRTRTIHIMGAEIPALPPGYQAYQLLLHMLQHYLRAGFGVKLLCDWAVFWNRDVPEEERALYLRLVGESGLKGFSDAVTLICCRRLGLDRERAAWMGFSVSEDVAEGLLTDILEGGEFGRSSGERMVSLRDAGLLEYVREFHHQICLRYPRGSRWVVCWPVLYVAALIHFVNNNRRIRGVSAWAVFRKARERSRLNGQMGLWKRS